MQGKFCLQAVDFPDTKNFIDFAAELLKLKALRPKREEKNYRNDASASFRVCELRQNLFARCGVRVQEGVLVVGGGLYPIRDVVFTYERGGEDAALTLAQKLFASPQKFLLTEPRLKVRAATLRPQYRPPKVETGEALEKVVRGNLLWQLYAISWGWNQLLKNPENAILPRQQRVRLRRLRSCLVFFKKLLPEASVYAWQQELRAQAEELSAMRELDVAAATCQSIRQQALRMEEASGAEHPPMPESTALKNMEALFREMRAAETQKYLSAHRLNAYTESLLRQRLWLERQTAQICQDGTAGEYVGARMKSWCVRLHELHGRYPDWNDMEDLHKVRIKVKRFRYVLQTVTPLRLDGALLARLKRLQDMLGFLHDDYVNDIWSQRVAQGRTDSLLLQEVSLFNAWQRLKEEAALARMPELWNDFLTALDAWVQDKV